MHIPMGTHKIYQLSLVLVLDVEIGFVTCLGSGQVLGRRYPTYTQTPIVFFILLF